jgi:lactate dehydrogenase-like 2-hydroxyacid dehydrogenase
MVIIGYGEIGAVCGKIVKAFGTKVIGLKRRPDETTEIQR